MIESANRYMIAGLIFLGAAIVLAIAMVTAFIYDHWIVWVAPISIAVALALVWFVRPLLRGST